MRKLFIVLAKIVGLYQMYIGLAYFSSTLMFFKVAGSCSSGDVGNLIFTGVTLFAFALLYFWFVWALLVRTEWLADKMGIKSDDILPTLNRDAALTVGFKLIGIYIFVLALSTLARVVVNSMEFPVGINSSAKKYMLKYSIPAIIKTVVAVVLLIRTDWILKVVKKGEAASNRAIIGGGCLILVLMTLVGYRTASNHAARDRYSYIRPEESSKSVTDGKPVRVAISQTTEWYRVQTPETSVTTDRVEDVRHFIEVEPLSILP